MGCSALRLNHHATCDARCTNPRRSPLLPRGFVPARFHFGSWSSKSLLAHIRPLWSTGEEQLRELGLNSNQVETTADLAPLRELRSLSLQHNKVPHRHTSPHALMPPHPAPLSPPSSLALRSR